MESYTPSAQNPKENSKARQFGISTHGIPTGPPVPPHLSGFPAENQTKVRRLVPLPWDARMEREDFVEPTVARYLEDNLLRKRTTATDQDDGTSIPSKQLKKESPEDFSNAVKMRLQSSSRTGQACDRCKVRKIRCDALPGGCSPCLTSNTECRTTDRTTGATRRRGYPEQLEEQNRTLQHRVRELEQRLKQGGGDIGPLTGYNEVPATNYDFNVSSNAQVQAWNSNAGSNLTSQDANALRSLPTFRTETNGENYLGVSAGNSNLSSIKGTALSILGMQIDIADFESADMDEPDPTLLHDQLYNKSYQAFLQTALNVNPRLERVELPPRQEGLTYAQWFFRVIHPYTPLLHRPTFFSLLTRMYDDGNFRPTVAERVIVHMIFALMFFQYAIRNWEDADQQKSLNDKSNMHYHYALSFFYQLSVSHQFQDVQALTLICIHIRNFPKPGASWMLTQITMAVAVEVGLHRSSERWPSDSRPNPLDREMRKRTFWCLLSLHVSISGRLGRPIVLKYEDFDVEMPESVDDELLTENGLDTSVPGKCLHEIGLVAFRAIPLYMELYSSIYAVRRDPGEYLARVNRLEAKLDAWKESLPTDLVKGHAGESEQEGRVFALYAQVWALEFRLLLRHPSVSVITDEKFNGESMRICVESSRQMLSAVRQLQKLKSLDTTWYQAAVYVLAITTTLFAQWDKRDAASAADLAALREEMDIWLEIIGDVGTFLGSGTRLREAVRVVTDSTLGLLSRSLPKKIVYNSTLEDTKPALLPPVSTPTQSTFSQSHQNYPSDAPNPNATSYIPNSVQPHQTTPYPSAYNSYAETNPPQILTYTPSVNYPTYHPGPQKFEQNEAPLLTTFATQTSQLPPNTVQYHQGAPTNASSSWQQYTTAMIGNLEMQDCYSASALMQLQGSREIGISQQQQQTDMVATIGMDGGQVSGNMEGQWPSLIFDVGQGSNNI